MTKHMDNSNSPDFPPRPDPTFVPADNDPTRDTTFVPARPDPITPSELPPVDAVLTPPQLATEQEGDPIAERRAFLERARNGDGDKDMQDFLASIPPEHQAEITKLTADDSALGDRVAAGRNLGLSREEMVTFLKQARYTDKEIREHVTEQDFEDKVEPVPGEDEVDDPEAQAARQLQQEGQEIRREAGELEERYKNLDPNNPQAREDLLADIDRLKGRAINWQSIGGGIGKGAIWTVKAILIAAAVFIAINMLFAVVHSPKGRR